MPRKPRSRRYDDLPVTLEGATAFSDDPEATAELWIVRLLRSRPEFLDALRKACAPRAQSGRRLDGHWELAYLAFVCSGQSDIQPWWARASEQLWRECGFPARPGYHAAYENFVRLEAHAEDFRAAAGQAIRHARKASGGLVGRDLHADFTEAETNARLRHACPKSRPCWKQRSRSYARPGAKTADADLDQVKRDRHRQGELPEDQVQGDQAPLGPQGSNIWTDADGRLFCRVGRQGCTYEILDRTAGVRAYSGPRSARRFWVGFYNGKLIDHYTGAPLAVNHFSASMREHAGYPALFQRGVQAIGQAPRSVVADKGLSISSVFELHTRAGTASVMPYRRPNGSVRRQDENTPEHDMHGIPRCKHCGGPTQRVRFHPANPAPRLWFACILGATPDCQRQQSISCSRSWRMLLPMWRTEEAYLALRDAHDRYERVHQHWRDRYRVAADDHNMRPKRRGLPTQELRAQAALLIEWLRILWREGWLGSARRNPGKQAPAQDTGRAAQLAASRRAAGLHLPYGPAALRAGLGPPGRAGPGP